MLTIAYVRVSTDDQTEHSPDAQRRRCAEFAQAKNLGTVRFLSDEGASGKSLDRPAMRELIGLIELNEVAHVVVWRLDRLSRDSGDTNYLLKLFERHCVQVHSLNEGIVESSTASGRFTAGIHGLVAQHEREKIIENVKMGMEQAARSGYWINRPPTGYDLIDRVLVANDDAHLVRRVFAIRAAGDSYPTIASGTGLNYSTVRHICENRAYLGDTRLRDQWFPGLHEPLVADAQFDAAQRAHTPGRRTGTDLLTGRVRCGQCGRLAPIDTNGRGKPIYRCRHRGKGCRIPGRSAAGLHRAARLGIDLLRQDDELIDAIRAQFASKTTHTGPGSAEPSRAGALASLRTKRDKLLALYLDDKITADYFADQERTLSAKIDAIEHDHAEHVAAHAKRSILVDTFERAAAMLRDPAFDLEQVWDNASTKERRVMVEELIEAITIYPDRLEVTVAGAPPLIVTLAEVGLRDPGTGPVVPEGGREPPRALGACALSPENRSSCS